MKFDKSQTDAIAAATTNRFSVITGSAGTGKTTIIKAITDQLESRGETVALAAFAGKAAARVREACDHPATTIHRMLGYNGKRFMEGDLSYRSVILDEASMIDALLMAEIIRRKPRRLCLVGDPSQLPPVGRGQPYHDIINLRPDIVSTLTTCYRATEAVYQAASVIRSGGRPTLFTESPGEKWTMMNTGSAARTHKMILEWVEADMFDFENDIILVARNGETADEPCTVRGLNAAISQILRPRDEKTKFVKGDRVMNLKNLPAIDCWNGTTGTVHEVDIDGGIWIRLDTPAIIEGNPTMHVLFGKDIRRHLQLAYAVTVHKSQGSQHRRVLFAAFRRDTWGLLDRSLLYTAVTRTKQACAVVGELGAVWAAIEKLNHKRTCMQVIAEQGE